MKQRCLNPAVASFPQYGGRGVKISGRWLAFKNFLTDMGERPAGTSLDRIDPNGNYEPANCRWLQVSKQQHNRRTTLYLTVDGITKPVPEWASEHGLSPTTLAHRVRSGEKAPHIFRPARAAEKFEGKTLDEWAAESGVSRITLFRRVYHEGRHICEAVAIGNRPLGTNQWGS